ncbi:MAG: hypothetical protein WKG07_04610 [Hymenobacter sp.]
MGSNGVLARTVPLPGNRVRYEWHASATPLPTTSSRWAVAPYVGYVSPSAQPAGRPAGCPS